MTNIYQAPGVDLTEDTVAFEGQGSIENGIAGNYSFSIGEILSEAWEKTKGSKGTIWLAFLFYMVVVMVVMFGLQFGLRAAGLVYVEGGSKSSMIAFGILSQVIQMLVSLPLGMGLFMIGLKRVVNAPAEATDIFAYFNKTLSMLGTMILMYLMIIVGFCLFVIPGIYLMVAYYLALPLVVEKNLSPWQALEASRKAITHRWFAIFGFCIVMILIMVISMIPLGIGMIWTLPMAMLAYGIIYRNIFGYGGAVAAVE